MFLWSNPLRKVNFLYSYDIFFETLAPFHTLKFWRYKFKFWRYKFKFWRYKFKFWRLIDKLPFLKNRSNLITAVQRRQSVQINHETQGTLDCTILLSRNSSKIHACDRLPLKYLLLAHSGYLQKRSAALNEIVHVIQVGTFSYLFLVSGF